MLLNDELLTDTTRNGYIDPPLGEVELHGIPFYFLVDGYNSVTTQTTSLPENPKRIDVANLQIANPTAVYLLLTGGNVDRDFLGLKIGAIELHFSDGVVYGVDLVPGQNFREWKLYGDKNVTWLTDPNAEKVWSGRNRFDDSEAIMDMLTVDVPSHLRSEILDTVSVVDTSQESIGSLAPAINVLGITVASR